MLSVLAVSLSVVAQPPVVATFAPPLVTTINGASHYNSWVNGTNITKCLADNCAQTIKACAADATCSQGIKCVESCKAPVTETCVEGCVKSYMCTAMMEVGICAETNGCIPSALIPHHRASMLGEDPATYAPERKHLLGEDPATYAPERKHLLGEDPATYAPERKHLLGEDPATYAPGRLP
jgi:hypothetical protein